MNNSLIVFLRKPIKGQVKSRLAKEVGENKALEVYRWLLDVTFHAFKRLKFPVNLYFDQSEGKGPYWAENYLYHVQKGEDLGSRIVNSFSEQLKISGKTVMIGSDCPEMNEKIITEAFKTLENQDLVLGPAKDGGIYLIGMKNLNMDLFNNIPWSGPFVFNRLKENASKLSMNYSVLQEMQDIDYFNDFLSWENKFEQFKEFKKYVIKRAS